MDVAPGEYRIGPPASRLCVRTARQGIAARVGHDLLIEAREWHGRVHVPADQGAPSVEVEVDLRELHVVEGTGGVKPLTDGDRQEIRRAMQKSLGTAAHPIAAFGSTAVRVDGDRAVVTGDLTLAGRTAPVSIELRQEGDGTLAGTASVAQTDWGIKPYTGLFGALKLRDEVGIELTVALSSP